MCCFLFLWLLPLVFIPHPVATRGSGFISNVLVLSTLSSRTLKNWPPNWNQHIKKHITVPITYNLINRSSIYNVLQNSGLNRSCHTMSNPVMMSNRYLTKLSLSAHGEAALHKQCSFVGERAAAPEPSATFVVYVLKQRHLWAVATSKDVFFSFTPFSASYISASWRKKVDFATMPTHFVVSIGQSVTIILVKLYIQLQGFFY